MGKKLLIIGNGFDLAHGLPTSYANFLDFSKIFLYRQINSKNNLYNWKGNSYIKERLIDLFNDGKEMFTVDSEHVQENKAIIEELDNCLKGNIWYNYLINLHKKNKIKGVNWIDFETEISEIIQWLDRYNDGLHTTYENLKEKMIRSNVVSEKTKIFHMCVDDANSQMIRTVEEFINRLYEDLEKLIQAINIYLYMFVEQMDIEKLDIISDIEPDYIVSFNYTHTYQRAYRSDIPICYIHGECKKSSCDECNMVVGIDEYLEPGLRNSKTDMAIFKKFVQRIRKRNSTGYNKWCIEMDRAYEKQKRIRSDSVDASYFSSDFSDIYVFGHSLDITDKDILELFLKPEYSSLHIYVKDKVNEGKLISNLIKIIGQEELVNKANSNPTRLEMIMVQ